MRLLIGSDGPVSLGQQADIRAWTHRVLWFAEDGDAIVLMDVPDSAFVSHVTGLTGVNASTLRFHIMPSRWSGGNFDAWALLDKGFQNELAVDAVAATEVVALWPCAEVGWLVRSLGIEHKLAGAGFWCEGGGVLANSKVVFRSLAAGTGVPIALGGVCRCTEDAFRLSGYLLREGSGFMVKRSYGGGGAGNEIVITKVTAVAYAGHASIEMIEESPEGLHAYWERRWSWASCNGAHPVVIEEFVANARTIYAEVFCSDAGVGAGKLGELKYKDGRIAREIFPAQDISAQTRCEIENMAARLGQIYWKIGYRGFLSLDSVITPGDHILFTEANARFTSSTHLHQVIAERVAQIADAPERIVIQTTSPASWNLCNLNDLLKLLAQHRLAYDPATRRGIMAVTPVVGDSGRLQLATVADSEEAAIQLIDALHDAITSPATTGTTE